MEKYKISNHLIFALVMQDKEICKRFLERIFNGKVIKEMNLKSEINLDEYETTIENTIISNPEAKSVRLDVLFEGDDTWYDIEMQSNSSYFSPKRMRYYSSSMDINQLDVGERNYEKLKTNYVIFICDFDYYGLDEAIYSFQYYDKDKKVTFDDGTYMIVLNAKCSSNRIPDQLRGLYYYIDKSIVDKEDDLVKDMDIKVTEISKDRRLKYIMTLADEMAIEKRIERELGVKEGIALGIEQGIEKGISQGIEQGITQEKLEIAKNMKSMDYSSDDIMKITGLTKKEIEKL